MFGNDTSQSDQQRRLVGLALDVGRTLTRLNIPQGETLDTYGVLLAHYVMQNDELQYDVDEGTENNDAGGNQLRQEIAVAILAASTAADTREASQPEPADNSGQDGDNNAGGDGTTTRDSVPSDSTSLPGGVPIDPVRMNLNPGNLIFMTESTIDLTPPDEESSGTQEERAPTTDTVAGGGAEIETLSRPGSLTEADMPPRIEIPQPDGSGEPVALFGETTPAMPSPPIYHDPRPPFETDGRGRVVWSNSSQQAQLRKSSDDETRSTRDKENDEPTATGPGICGDVDGSGGGDHCV